jgi:hypothetical protein
MQGTNEREHQASKDGLKKWRDGYNLDSLIVKVQALLYFVQNHLTKDKRCNNGRHHKGEASNQGNTYYHLYFGEPQYPCDPILELLALDAYHDETLYD